MRLFIAALLAAGGAATIDAAKAGEIVVTIEGAETDEGEIGCGLYSSETGFPMDSAYATQFWKKPIDGGAVCRFENLSPGDYAVATSHDLNGNRETDTNFLGIPREEWGVSNNVRPRLRAPRFDEAKVTLNAGETLSLTIELDK